MIRRIPIILIADSGAAACGPSVAVWNDESSLLTAAFDDSVHEAKGYSKGATLTRIEATLGIREKPVRVLVGELEFYFDYPNSQVVLDYRSNPARWRRRQLPISDKSARGAAHLEVDGTLDENFVLSVPGEVQPIWDNQSSSLGLVLSEQETSMWASLAPGILAGAVSDGELVELRFELPGHGFDKNGKFRGPSFAKAL